MSTPTKYEGHTPGPWHATGKNVRYRLPGFSTTEKLADCDTEATAVLVADAPALLAERDALQAENTRLREALRDSLRWVGHSTKQVSRDGQAESQHIAGRDQCGRCIIEAALAAGKGEMK